MKRIGNLYEKIVDLDNLREADRKAQKGKARQYGVRMHNMEAEQNLFNIHASLLNKTYKTSPYDKFKIFETKERDVCRLPYNPDRIAHHAIMNVLEPVFVANFTADTYSCIKRRGIHAAVRNMKKALRDREGTVYCLKLDITKFYPSVDHDVLKALLRRKFKDADLLWLLDEIIDSAEGVPIGNYLSQYLANFYLSNFDHWLKEQKGVKYYFRYADDIVILSGDKPYLHALLFEIKGYLKEKLKLTVKDNYQVFPVASRGIDFIGYCFYHTHTRIRKRIKQRFARRLAKCPTRESVAAYMGWMKHADCKHLLKKLINEKLQRTGNQTRHHQLHGRKNKHRQRAQQESGGIGLPDSAVQVQAQNGKLPTPTAGGRRPKKGVVHRQPGPHGHDRAGAQIRLPL